MSFSAIGMYTIGSILIATLAIAFIFAIKSLLTVRGCASQSSQLSRQTYMKRERKSDREHDLNDSKSKEFGEAKNCVATEEYYSTLLSKLKDLEEHKIQCLDSQDLISSLRKHIETVVCENNQYKEIDQKNEVLISMLKAKIETCLLEKKQHEEQLQDRERLVCSLRHKIDQILAEQSQDLILMNEIKQQLLESHERIQCAEYELKHCKKELSKDAVHCEQKLESAVAKHIRLTEELNDREEKFQLVEMELSVQKDELTHHRKRISELQSERTLHLHELEQLKTQLQNINDEYCKSKHQCSTIQQQLEDLRLEWKKAKDELNSLQIVNGSLKQELKETKMKIECKKTEIKELKEALYRSNLEKEELNTKWKNFKQQLGDL